MINCLNIIFNSETVHFIFFKPIRSESSFHAYRLWAKINYKHNLHDLVTPDDPHGTDFTVTKNEFPIQLVVDRAKNVATCSLQSSCKIEVEFFCITFYQNHNLVIYS